MKKQLFILGLLFLTSFLSAVFLFSRQRNVSPPPPPDAPPEIKPPPSGLRVPDAPTKVVFSYVGEKEAFPSEIPLYKTEMPLLTETQISALAKKMGFSDDPTVKSSEISTRRYWNEKDKSFSFVTTSLQQSVSYQKLFSPPSNSIVEKESLVASAQTFLSQLSPSSFSFRGSIQEGAVFDGLVIQENPKPSLFLIKFVFLVNNKHPLLVANYDSPVSSVIIDDKGIVRSLTLVFPPSLIQTKMAKILPLDVALDGLSSGKGLLLSSQKEGVMGSVSGFTSVLVKNVSLFYIKEENSNLVVPVFIFSGSARGKKGEVLDVRYLLYASTE